MFGNLRFGVLLLAVIIAFMLWGVARGTSQIERIYDIPVELRGLDEKLVVTDLSHDAVNVHIRGSRAALRGVQPAEMTYYIDVKGSKRGTAEYEVDTSQLELPTNTRVASRSPSQIQVRFERRGRKAVRIRADIEGEPATGHELAKVEILPRVVWLAGARSQVLRLREVVTEPIDISGVTETQEREARLFLGGGTVWREDEEPVVVRIEITPPPEPEIEEGAAGAEQQG